jgi:hypothetical protein
LNAATEPRNRRASRRKLAWALCAALLLLLAMALLWLAQPARVAGIVLGQAGTALGLEITTSGVSEYRLRGTPMLVVRGLVAREPGAPAALLRAERVYLSLPWSTLRARGADLTVQRVELDAPVLDLAALQRWRERRPSSQQPARIPTLVDGLHITDGEVLGDGWSIDRIVVALPSLHPERRVAGRVGGRFRNGDTSIPFDLQLALSRIGMDAGVGASGIASVVTPEWRMPMRLTSSGRLHEDNDGFGLDRFRLGADASHRGGGTPLHFVFGIAGPVRYSAGHLLVAPLGLVVRGEGAVPDLDARGEFGWDGAIGLQLDGALAQWPEAWPAVPAPLAEVREPIAFVLDHAGPLDLSGSTMLRVHRDATRFDARFCLPRVLEWVDGIATGTPLPPLDGSLQTPVLHVPGATLEGVSVEFDDGQDHE